MQIGNLFEARIYYNAHSCT